MTLLLFKFVPDYFVYNIVRFVPGLFGVSHGTIQFIFRFVPGLFGVSHGAIQFMAYEDLKNRYLNYYNLPLSSK